MAERYRSEIRDSAIRDLISKVRKQDYGAYLKRIRLNKVRAFSNQVVDFEFPVSALIGTNGGGKSTILGAAAIAYKKIKPALFFPKSSIGDNSMANWSVSYEVIQKSVNPTQPIQRSARFKRLKWARDDLLEREVLYFGIARTVPAGERSEFKRLATRTYKYSGKLIGLSELVQKQVARILGKDVSRFHQADITPKQQFYTGSDGVNSYSEFHFGAGESSIIRMVREIEVAPVNTLVLIEEIENGLHPVAVRRMVEYLVDVAERKSIQSIFTTHSEDALLPLPSEAIWSSIDGKVNQGRVSIEALRAITGRIDESMAIFVEDGFAVEWVEALVRRFLPTMIDQIGVYGVNGDTIAKSTHDNHSKNPAISGKLKSICILDGDSKLDEDIAGGILKLPGADPESEVFNYVRENIEALSMRLAVALHLPPESDAAVKKIVEEVALSNRDPHLLFNQVGQKAGFIPQKIVSSAFIGLWLQGKAEESKRVSNFIGENLESFNRQN